MKIVIIPAEGDSVETEKWYAEDIEKHYHKKPLIFKYNGDHEIELGIERSIRSFFSDITVTKVEIHAQGGFGAIVAHKMISMYPWRIRRVFFIGGASSAAMNFIQKFFHRHLSRLWYLSRIPFFADDPNPTKDEKIALIKKSSTECIRRDPLLYRNQLVAIGRWDPKDWRLPEGIEAYFVPNGDSPRPDWWDNSYNNEKARAIWKKLGVSSTEKPGGWFSFYSLMPSGELFKVLDKIRNT